MKYWSNIVREDGSAQFLIRTVNSARSELHDFALTLSLFQLCGYTGFLLSFLQSLVLVRHFGLSQLTLLGMTGTVILTFYVLMMITKILANGEVIIYYHHEIAVIATCALFLRLTRQPVLPYLDILVLGLGLFLACGRIGCLMVGCCHGRPRQWGIRYRIDHSNAGFLHHLVGVKLFPIQAVESLTAFCITTRGVFLLLHPHEPGSILLFYVIAYGIARFFLEFLRGDSARPHLLGFSEAQWTSLALAIAAVMGARAHVLPASTWHWLVPVCLAAFMLLLALWRRLDPSRQFELLHPSHLREIAGVLQHLNGSLLDANIDRQTGPLTIHIAQTSRGYQFSIGETAGTSGPVKYYCLSKKNGPLSPRAARTLARLITNLDHNPRPFTLLKGSTGAFHILLDDSSHSSRPHQPSLLGSLQSEIRWYSADRKN